jgi:large subunit ribosomal protein L15
MNIKHLQKLVKHGKKRLGRGHGSGRVKTSGRGTKGQNARDNMPPAFEGGQAPLIKRLPLLRGKFRNFSRKPKAFPISINKLNIIPAGTTVSLATLVKYHMIDTGILRVKILGKEKLDHALTVVIPCSEGAKKAVEKAGGTVKSSIQS